MSDTPRTDPECKDIQGDAYMISVPGNGDYVYADFARQLESELNEANHRIRRLIEERDSARIQADHKWRLREEFEALLGTSDVETGVERVKEAQRGAARYEYLRTLNKREFTALKDECLLEGLNFDAEVDRRRNQT